MPELDDAAVLKRLAKQFAISIFIGLISALVGALFAFITYPLIRYIEPTVFTSPWGGFLWVELGAAIAGLIGFTVCWRGMSKQAKLKGKIISSGQ
jgi:hypothetical protein